MIAQEPTGSDVRFSLSTRSRERVILQLRKFTPQVRKVIKDTIGEYGAREYQLAYDLCPKDTFFMANALGIEFSKGGYSYRIGWKRSDFTAAGKPGYFLYQELGFRHHITGQFIQNPCIVPARFQTQPRFLRALERNIKKATRQAQRVRR